MKIEVVRLSEDARLPEYSHSGDAGMDLFSVGHGCMEQGQRMLIKTGVSMAIPEGYVGLIWPRSGLALKKGVDVLAGVIDSGYRGEVGVVLLNTGYDDLMIKPGEKIAQIVIQPVVRADVVDVVDFGLSDSRRGVGGFGSTGE
jgi:dUTP pyrophosphatase